MKPVDKVYSTDGEVFNYDELDFDIGDTYYSGDKVEIKPSELLFANVSNIIDSMEEQLYDKVGDVYYGALSVSENSILKLERMLADFVDEHFSISCYAVDNIEEHIMENIE